MLLEMLFNKYDAIAILPLFRENSNTAKLGSFDDLVRLRENSKQKARHLTNVPSSGHSSPFVLRDRSTRFSASGFLHEWTQ